MGGGSIISRSNMTVLQSQDWRPTLYFHVLDSVVYESVHHGTHQATKVFFFFYSLQSENKKLGLCLLWLISIQLTLDNGSTQQTLRLHKQPLHRLKKHKGHVTATSERDSIPEGASIESLLNQNQERKWIHETRWPHFQWPCLALKTSFIGRDNFQAEGHRVLR